MQRIELSVFKNLFGKSLTGNEIDFIITLSHMQDEQGNVCGLYYKEMMQETGMSAQAFYDCKKSLQEKGLIEVQKGINDYNITLIGNDFSQYTNEDYKTGKVRYVKTNCKLFTSKNWKKLKPAQKLLAMDLLHISKASSGRTHRIGRKKFIEKYAGPEGILGINERTLQKYIKMLKLFFYIGIKDGMYLITLRSCFAEDITKTAETTITFSRVLEAMCRRNKIIEPNRKEVKGIVKLLCDNRKKLLQGSVYIPEIFSRMLEVINQRVLNRKKWKRYLKASLFNKLLRDEFLIAE